ncbi:hypothetical protein BJ742DRAFT_824061 [Cladochytrium replicatum]|nr:hypothetical protein BJ742DRAFT_824061 [Cladochytrium replicatum]
MRFFRVERANQVLTPRASLGRESWLKRNVTQQPKYAWQGFWYAQRNISDNFQLYLLGLAKQGPNLLVYRKDIRALSRAKSDALRIVPSTVLMALPLSNYMIRPLMFTIPSFVCASILTSDQQRLRLSAIYDRRNHLAPRIVASMKPSLNHLSFAQLINDANAVINYAQILNILPFLVDHFGLSDLSWLAARRIAAFLDIPLPSVLPDAKLVQWTDAILKDDMMIRRDGIEHLNMDELVEALEDRGFIDIHALSPMEMQIALLNHTRFTKNLVEVVSARSSRGQLAERHLCGVGMALVLGRCLNVKQ